MQRKQRIRSEISVTLADLRINLEVLRRLDHRRMYAECLIEYARMLGKWEENL